MGVFPEAEARLFKDVYICRKCEHRTKVPIGRVLAGKATCRNCGSEFLRPVRKRAKK
ncbi:50S ribosomal protein L40e [Candidatus Woesearchaeota archaeon]|nr:50S ribosomal protein L40e [Nanoarchaeota archaeon]MCB9370009.1 50S ribosomal protein L40e [Candidatus Woesearchaeota archaeon]USN44544.1 MAG: 50S ribosomal protein L40e [Candidatus Woesearchaeota archaeon]